MHFQTIFAAGLLQAAAVSAVHYLTPDNAGRNKGANYCGQYAPMDDQFGLKSCSQEDVQLLINSFLATPDAYISIGTSWARAGTAGACAFSIAVIPGQLNGNVVLGGFADFADLSQNALWAAQNAGAATGGWLHPRVDSSGTLPCDQPPANGGHDNQVYVQFIVASSESNPPQLTLPPHN
ncbi:unnamed protein product [Zymoseptoria tritici ST99CH_1E4]|uniref:Ecp2 effector protein domain-containing protein n=1 Tax=Zymoseptoria tritici ST99CH_1E4 TaxID=1276532 RepID=A0A2H1GFY6_ZYMTR|nr:unnamed protein product [Zymoseptoria tritici ST99CH_1E4]